MDFAYAIAHYFFPRQSNNQKAKVLHSSTLFFLTLFLVIFQVIIQVLPLSGIKILGYGANIAPSDVINLTNTKRQELGLNSLEYSSMLSQAAQAKGQDMIAKDYWAHVSPDGIQPWYFITNAGYKYRYAGENLARDFSDPGSAVEAWIASPSHRENILSAKYQEIGVAVIEGDLAGVETTLIVQLFGAPYVDTTPQVPIAEARTPTEAVPTPLLSPQPTTAIVAQGEPVLEPLTAGDEQVLVISEGGVQASKPKILISPFNTTRTLSLFTIGSLLLILVVDSFVASKKKVARVGGRTFAHLAFLGMVLAIVLIAKAGQIL